MVPVVGAFGVQRARRRQLHRLLLVFADCVGLCISVVLATYVRFGNLGSTSGFEDTTTDGLFVQLGALLVPVWILMLWAEGLYDLERLSWGSGELSRVARSLALGVVALILVTYVIKLPGLSRAWSLLFWLFATLAVLFGRASIKLIQRFQHIRGLNLRPVLVVGSNSESADIIHVLNASRAEGLVPVGCLASSQADRLNLDWCAHDVPCLGSARDLRSVVQEHDIDTVIIASTAFEHEVLARLVTDLRGTGVDIHISSGLLDVLASRVLVREIGGVPLITVKGVFLSRTNILTKRLFDLVVASSIVIVAMPLWFVVMLLIRLTPGPVFYRQVRVGRDGEHFGMFKFRSMVMDAETLLQELKMGNEASGPLFKM
ncbi:MAG: sugar transferase, partial [Coriobacteriia bacterium]|nr:sugar transferase [Coriobacteriia bacterium]